MRHITISLAVFAAILLFLPCQALAQICGGGVVCVALHSKAGGTPVTNGAELVFRNVDGVIESNVRGAIAIGTQPDVNASGEIVYVVDIPGGMAEVRSTTRGLLAVGAIPNPALNSLGEVVYYDRDNLNSDQVFSTTRGQFSFFDGSVSREGELALDDSGRVVLPLNKNLWEIDPVNGLRQLTFLESPQQARQSTLAAATGELVYIVIDNCDVTVVSERDGVLFTGGNVCGPDRGSFPDLGPHGELVFLDHAEDLVVRPAFVLRTASDEGICGVVGASCPTLQVIPAISRPGLAVAALLLLGLGAWAIRRGSVFKSAA